MLQQVKFTCTALKGTDKKGVLSKDKFGYYELPLGALNVFNSAGEYYPVEESKKLFSSNSLLMSRIRNGRLRGELGHPKRDGLSKTEYIRRCSYIYEQCVCCHISEVWLDYERFKDTAGRPIVGIFGKVSGSGPYADTFERDVNNPKANACMSIRTFTDDLVMGGRVNKILREIVTWDMVNEPGIESAAKFRSPTLEDMSINVTRGEIEKAFMDDGLPISMENSGVDVTRLLGSLGLLRQEEKKIITFGW